MPFLLRLCLGLVLLAPSLAYARSSLDVPSDGDTLSGIGVIHGWKCTAEGEITIVFNEGDPEADAIPTAYGFPRDDTRTTCRDEGTNGFHSVFNWAILGDGVHTAVAYDNGVEFARSTFTVTTTGEEFVTGASARVRVSDFPAPGETARFEWNESTQHLEMVRTPEEEELVEHIQHVVIVWLKDPASAEARQQVIAASYGFTAIPGVLSVSAGPSVPSPRAVVDSSYDVGVVITVRDRAALTAYLEHPTHKHAVQEVLGPLARQIVVYDFAVSAPQ